MGGVEKARNTHEKCRALSNYDTCFVFNSLWCSSNLVSSLTKQIDSAKSSFSCETTPADISASNPDADDSQSNSESNSNAVKLVCDATGITKCVNDFRAGTARVTNMAAKCSLLDAYETCVVEKSSGCSDSQKTAFTIPIDQAKSSLSCSKEPVSSVRLRR